MKAGIFKQALCEVAVSLFPECFMEMGIMWAYGRHTGKKYTVENWGFSLYRKEKNNFGFLAKSFLILEILEGTHIANSQERPSDWWDFQHLAQYPPLNASYGKYSLHIHCIGNGTSPAFYLDGQFRNEVDGIKYLFFNTMDQPNFPRPLKYVLRRQTIFCEFCFVSISRYVNSRWEWYY